MSDYSIAHYFLFVKKRKEGAAFLPDLRGRGILPPIDEMLYIIAIGCIILCLVFPSNKYIGAFMLVFIWVLFAFNERNPDRIPYEIIYRQIRNGNADVTTVNEEGFILLCSFCSKVLKLSYQQFIILLATFCTLLLGITANLFTKNKNIVYALFIIYPYWINITQIRSYVASLIVMLGLYFLFRSDSLKDDFLFVFFTVLGGFFHRTAWIFLLFYFSKKSSVKTVSIAAAVMAAGLFSVRVPVVSNILSHVLSVDKIRTWLMSDGSRSILGIAILITIRIMLIFIEWFLLNQLKKIRKQADIRHILDQKQDSVIFRNENILKATIMSMAFVSMEAFVPDFERLFRVVMMLSYCQIADYINYKKFGFENIPLVYLAYVGFVVLYVVYFFIGFGGYFNSVVRPVFEGNMLNIFGT